MEFPLCRMALEKGKPILAICRGHQVLSCVLGGNMFQDIETQFSAELRHPRSDMPRDKVHKVQVVKGTLLHAITGLTELEVNSRHHQAVNVPGKGMTISARATDGLIEALELPGKSFVLGVQWHPESLSDRYPEAQALFNAFAEACGR
jgi:putative glutamine amidotransferase